jgi:hypothetical protein
MVSLVASLGEAREMAGVVVRGRRETERHGSELTARGGWGGDTPTIMVAVSSMAEEDEGMDQHR